MDCLSPEIAAEAREGFLSVQRLEVVLGGERSDLWD